MVQVLRCHNCELVVSVDCSQCQHSMTAKGTIAACDPREMGVNEFQLIAFPKGKMFCLSCCGMDPEYVKMWHSRHQWLQKTKPCSACVVTLLRVPKRPVLLAEFIPPDMQPRPVHSSTTCGCSSPWQDPKAGADSKLLLEQQSKILLLLQQQEDMTHRLSVLGALEKRVLNMEARYLLENGSMLEDGDPWDVVQPH